MSTAFDYSDISPTDTWDDADTSSSFLPTPSNRHKTSRGDPDDIYQLRQLKRRLEANGGTMDDGSSPPPYIQMRLREIDETQRVIEEDMALREAEAQAMTQQAVSNEDDYFNEPVGDWETELFGAAPYSDDEFEFDEIPIDQDTFNAEIAADNNSASMAMLDSHWQTQARAARIAEAMDVDPSQLALSQSFRRYPSYSYQPSTTDLAVAVILDAQQRRRARGKRNPTRARRRAEKQKIARKLLPGKGMARWQYEMSLRGRKVRGVWIWNYHDVSSFCRLKNGDVAKEFLRHGLKRSIVYRQVQLFWLATKLGGKVKYVHPSKRELDWRPAGYFKILLYEIRKLVDPEY